MRTRVRTHLIAAAAATALLATACTGGPGPRASSHGTGTPGGATSRGPAAGAPTLGDPILPSLGNGGYDVSHYDLALTWHPATRVLDGHATIAARATQALSAFTLDYAGPAVRSVSVDGAGAAFRVASGKLAVTPPTPLANGTPFRAVVVYGGAPRTLPFRAGPRLVIPEGWIVVDGNTATMDEPIGAHTWFPCNDHPSDKATFTFRLTAPSGLTAVANGRLARQTSSNGRTTTTYVESTPMATYLAQVAIGRYAVVRAQGPGGVSMRDVFLRGDVARMRPLFSRQPAMVAYLSSVFGPYPFPTYGSLVANGIAAVALETQTLTVFSRAAVLRMAAPELVADEAHELTHQWFGDDVSPATWRDVWLNEGFATYGAWLWVAHTGGPPVRTLAEEAMARLAAQPGLPPTALPTGPETLFGDEVYDGGGVALEALRIEVGDGAFLRIVHEWLAAYGGRSATTARFVALASRVAGRDLSAFLRPWLDGPRPASLPAA